MWIKVWPDSFFHTDNISQAHCESWKVCLSVVANLLILSLAGKIRIRAVGGPFFLLLRFILIIIIMGQTEPVNFGCQCRNGTGERFYCRSLPTVISIVIAISSMAFSNMVTLEALEP
jgi:hypothetical protein